MIKIIVKMLFSKIKNENVGYYRLIKTKVKILFSNYWHFQGKMITIFEIIQVYQNRSFSRMSFVRKWWILWIWNYKNGKSLWNNLLLVFIFEKNQTIRIREIQ